MEQTRNKDDAIRDKTPKKGGFKKDTISSSKIDNRQF